MKNAASFLNINSTLKNTFLSSIKMTLSGKCYSERNARLCLLGTVIAVILILDLSTLQPIGHSGQQLRKKISSLL